MGRFFLEYVTPLTSVSSLRYLGRTLFSTEGNWAEVEWNLWRAWGKWGRLMKIFGREGADNRTTGRFYMEVVQAVLLFGSKTWVLTPDWRTPSQGSTTRRHGGWREWAPIVSRTRHGCNYPLERS